MIESLTVLQALGIGSFLLGCGVAAVAVRTRRVSRERTPPSPVAPAIEVAPVSAIPAVPMVSIREIRAEVERRRRDIASRSGEYDVWLDRLAANTLESDEPREILEKATAEERANIAVFLGLRPETKPREIAFEICRAGSHTAAAVWRGWISKPQYVDYLTVANDVAHRLGATASSQPMSTLDAERAAIEAAFKQVLAKMSPAERDALLGEIARKQRTSAGAIGATGAALMGAHLAGFGLYVAASTALSVVAGAVGVTLPFAVYTGMSSMLAVVVGPVGWAALAGVAIAKLGGVNFKKTVPAVLAIGGARARLIAERDDSMERVKAERASELEPKQESLARLEAFLGRYENTAPTFSVPKSEVPW